MHRPGIFKQKRGTWTGQIGGAAYVIFTCKVTFKAWIEATLARQRAANRAASTLAQSAATAGTRMFLAAPTETDGPRHFYCLPRAELLWGPCPRVQITRAPLGEAFSP